MQSSRPRGPRIIYVTSSARELPAEVQEWLSRPEHRAARSPDIYDALALLASGSRPVVMLVAISAVDWSEMEFFDQVARLSRDTRVYVAGSDHESAKLEAACRRGARRFDADELAEDLAHAPAPRKALGVGDILAGQLQPVVGSAPAQQHRIKPVAPEPGEEEAPPEAVADAKPPVQPVVRLVSSDPTETEEESDLGPEVEVEKEAVLGEVPIPFPWSPSPNRPQRLPPRREPAEPKPAAASAGQPPAANQAVEPPAPRPPAELTAEELAALMGRPVPPERSAREGRG